MGEPARAAPRRRARRIITVEELYDAAVAVVDAEGLASLSMRRLSDATGIAPMTIYGFVANKDELLAGLAGHVLQELPDPLAEDEGWRARIVHEMSGLRDAMVRHAGLVELLTVGSDAAPVLDRLRERLLGILRGSGADDRVVVEGLGSLIALTLGFAVGSRMRHVGLRDEGYQRLSDLPAGEFPNLTDLADQYAEHWSDRSYTRGLTAILDAIDAAARA
jgi:TetR/AcrR family transcriptional regulator, tetracycline repressor protein